MKARYLLVLAALWFCGPSAAPAQAELPPAAREVMEQVEQESAEIEKQLEADLKKRQEKTVNALKAVQDQLCREDKLDEAAAVRTLLRSIESGTHDVRLLAPTDRTAAERLCGALTAALDEAGFGVPATVREIRRRHDREVASLYAAATAKLQKHRDRAVAELEKVKAQYCKDVKLDEALAVRDMIRLARAGGRMVKGLPDPGYVNNPAEDIGKVFYYDVTGVETGGSIWGSGIYTTGSSLAMAAVHSGVLRAGQRGVVKVTIVPGQANYAATKRNGVTSLSYGTWGVSFKVERAYGLAVRVANKK